MLYLILHLFAVTLRSRRALILENVALRHQVQVLKRRQKRPRLRNRDRLLWVLLRRIWPDWRRPLIIIQPDTVTPAGTARSSATHADQGQIEPRRRPNPVLPGGGLRVLHTYLKARRQQGCGSAYSESAEMATPLTQCNQSVMDPPTGVQPLASHG